MLNDKAAVNIQQCNIIAAKKCAQYKAIGIFLPHNAV